MTATIWTMYFKSRVLSSLKAPILFLLLFHSSSNESMIFISNMNHKEVLLLLSRFLFLLQNKWKFKKNFFFFFCFQLLNIVTFIYRTYTIIMILICQQEFLCTKDMHSFNLQIHLMPAMLVTEKMAEQFLVKC